MIIKKMFIISRVSHHDINKNTLQSQNNAKLADGLDTECKLDASKQLDAYNLSNEKHKCELSQGRVSWFLQCAAINNHEMCQCNWVYTGEMSDLLCTLSTRTPHFQPKMSHCSEQTAVEVRQPVSPNGTDDDNNNGEKQKQNKKTDFKKKECMTSDLPWKDDLPWKGQERATISQMNTGTVSKAMMGKLLRDGMQHIIMSLSKHIDTILKWTELWMDSNYPS